MNKLHHFQIAIILFIGIISQPCRCANIEIHRDSLASGWNYMDSCTLFQIKIDSSCSISWSVIKSKTYLDRTFFRDPKGLVLVHHNNAWRTLSHCNLVFEQTKILHTEILDSIFQRYPVSRFGEFVDESFSSWGSNEINRRIAIASLNAKEYQLFRRKHQVRRFSANRYFVDIANQSNSFRSVDSMFLLHNASIRMTSAEDMLESKVSDFPISSELIKDGYGPKSFAIWDAHNMGYKIIDLDQSLKSDTIQPKSK